MRNAVFISGLVIIMINTLLSADTLSIKGTVVENGSTPIGQVVVFEKGQKLFDTTDNQGRFEFKQFITASRKKRYKSRNSHRYRN